jgi:hypothetical protein
MNTRRTTAGHIIFLLMVLCATSARGGDVQPAQNGRPQRGVPRSSERFHDNSNETITDTLTGLMWAKNANLPGSRITWFQAAEFCSSLTLGGYTDWRLPDLNELKSLINDDEPDSAAWLNRQGFTNVQSYDYWSASTRPTDPIGVWLVHMRNGNVYNGYKSHNIYYVWPVRNVK